MLVISLLIALVVCCLLGSSYAGELVVDKVLETCKDGDVQTKAGDNLMMHYTGSIDESSATGVKGKVFDSSLRRNKPFDFVLGAGRVIKVRNFVLKKPILQCV